MCKYSVGGVERHSCRDNVLKYVDRKRQHKAEDEQQRFLIPILASRSTQIEERCQMNYHNDRRPHEVATSDTEKFSPFLMK